MPSREGHHRSCVCVSEIGIGVKDLERGERMGTDGRGGETVSDKVQINLNVYHNVGTL